MSAANDQILQAPARNRAVVLTRPLTAAQWDLVRSFVSATSRDDLRLRFGQPLDLRDQATLARRFDIEEGKGELILMLDADGAIEGVLHRVGISPTEAEIGLLVRTDRKRNGIGKALLCKALSRAAGQRLKRLSAVILRENTPMLRLARKMGFALRLLSPQSVELEVELTLSPEVVAHAC